MTPALPCIARTIWALKQGPFDDPFWKSAVLFGGPEKGPPNLENLPSVKEQDEKDRWLLTVVDSRKT